MAEGRTGVKLTGMIKISRRTIVQKKVSLWPEILSHGFLQHETAGAVKVWAISTTSRRILTSVLSLGVLIWIALSLTGCASPAASTTTSPTSVNYTVKTFSGISGYFNGTGTSAAFNGPQAVTYDSSGNLYVADTGNNVIRKITSAGVVTTLAGAGSFGASNGIGTAASFGYPTGLAVDSTGTNLYVADQYNNLVRAIVIATGAVTTLAGSGSNGFANGTGTSATFNNPSGLCLDSTGSNLYVADSGNGAIRKIVISTGVVTTFYSQSSWNPYGVVSDLSGNLYVLNFGHTDIVEIGSGGSLVGVFAGVDGNQTYNGDGSATTQTLNLYGGGGLAIDAAGANLYVSDFGNNLVRQISLSTPTITTFAGSANGFGDSTTGISAQFSSPMGLAVDANFIYVADYGNSSIRKVSLTSPYAVTTEAGKGGTGTSWAAPQGITVDSSGNVYVGDYQDFLVRKLSSTGVSLVLAGSRLDGWNGLSGTSATLGHPAGFVLDSAGNGYILEMGNADILKVAASTGTITMFASGFQYPNAFTIDASGNLYVANTGQNNIFKVTSAGTKSLFAGSSTGSSGSANNSSPTAATFNQPQGIAVDAAGNVYVGDSGNNLIRKITSSGTVTTFAGSGAAGSANSTTATAATFRNPEGVALDKSGNLLVADTWNNLIREVTTAGAVITIAGAGPTGLQNGSGAAATFNNPAGLALDASGNIFVTDTENGLIREITQ